MCHQSWLKSPNLLSIPYLAGLNKPPARVNHEWRSSKPERPTRLLHRGTRGVLPCFKPECMLNSHKKNALITILSNFDGDFVSAIRFIARSMQEHHYRCLRGPLVPSRPQSHTNTTFVKESISRASFAIAMCFNTCHDDNYRYVNFKIFNAYRQAVGLEK